MRWTIVAGMGLGALLIGPLGDRLGRRATVLLCLAILCVGMGLSAVARDVAELAATRLLTGLGIGGVLANINIVVAEYASDRWRNLSISLLSLGYPVGEEICGLVSGGCFQAFSGGSVYWTTATGAHRVVGPVLTYWAATGYERGKLGYPTGDPVATRTGSTQQFQGGVLTYTSATGKVTGP